MISTEYANAYTEILEIIKFIPDSDYKKIPPEYIQVFQKNSNANYCFKYNPQKTLDEQNVSNTTKDIIALLYRDFWANDEIKKKILKYQENRRLQIEKAKNEMYNPDLIFKQQTTQNQMAEKIQENENEVSMVCYKENIFTRFFNFIRNRFKW